MVKLGRFRTIRGGPLHIWTHSMTRSSPTRSSSTRSSSARSSATRSSPGQQQEPEAKPLQPTEEQRACVEAWLAAGLTPSTICAILAQDVDAPVSLAQFRRVFAAERADPKARIHARILRAVVRAALAGNQTALSLYGRTQLGWGEKPAISALRRQLAEALMQTQDQPVVDQGGVGDRLKSMSDEQIRSLLHLLDAELQTGEGASPL